MTPREPDRFDKQGDEVNRRCTHIFGATIGACPACVAAALRQATTDAANAAAQIVEAYQYIEDPVWVANLIRGRAGALASPAAAPAAEPSEPVAPAPDLMELFEQALALLESAQEVVGWRLQGRIAEFLQRSRTASSAAQGKETRK